MSFVKFSQKFCVAITNFMLVKSDLNILEANPLVLLRFSSSHGTDYGVALGHRVITGCLGCAPRCL